MAVHYWQLTTNLERVLLKAVNLGPVQKEPGREKWEPGFRTREGGQFIEQMNAEYLAEKCRTQQQEGPFGAMGLDMPNR